MTMRTCGGFLFWTPMSNLSPFKFQNQYEIRTLTREGEPWFVASDICEALGLDDTSKAVSRLDDDERGTNTVRTPSGNQEMLIINESGMYSLVLTSRKPEAKAFKKWVTSEVLPSIRKTGAYAVQKSQTPPTDPRQDPATLQAIGQITLQHAAQTEALRLECERLQQAVAEKGHAIAVLVRFKDGLLTLATRLASADLPRVLKGKNLFANLDKYEPHPYAGVFKFLPHNMQVDTLPDGTPWGEGVVKAVDAMLKRGQTRTAVSRQTGIPCKHIAKVAYAKLVLNQRAESLEFQRAVAAAHLKRSAGLPVVSRPPSMSVMNRQHFERPLTFAANLNQDEVDFIERYLDNLDPRQRLGC